MPQLDLVFEVMMQKDLFKLSIWYWFTRRRTDMSLRWWVWAPKIPPGPLA